MNELYDKYSDKGLAILAFPCNQFKRQQNCKDSEILNSLKYVRPGDGFAPNIEMFATVEVNGDSAHPLFNFLKSRLPFPQDDPEIITNNPYFIIWNPVKRNDIHGNFDKFLIDSNGEPVKRFSKKTDTIQLEPEIENLLAKM